MGECRTAAAAILRWNALMSCGGRGVQSPTLRSIAVSRPFRSNDMRAKLIGRDSKQY
jgi:hypothetical protein